MNARADMHWSSAWLGQEWHPLENDCWMFARRVWARQFGIEVPELGVDAGNLRVVLAACSGHAELAGWEPVATPIEGDGVLLGKGRLASHVGVWVDANGGAVLHCQQGAGSILSSRAMLDMTGWKKLVFYRRKT